MEPRLDIRAADEVPRALVEMLFGWFRDEFGLEEHTTSPASWRVLVWAEDELVGHVGIVERVGTVGAQPVRLGGIAGVVTVPVWRGRGVATAAMRAAQAFLRDHLDVAFGLLLCRAHRVSFYTRLGWQVIDAPLTFTTWEGERRQTAWHKTLILPLRDHAWPDGAIDLCGLPW